MSNNMTIKQLSSETDESKFLDMDKNNSEAKSVQMVFPLVIIVIKLKLEIDRFGKDAS